MSVNLMLCKFCQNIIDKKDTQLDVIVNCNVCSRVWCVKCDQEGHLGYTCKEWEKRSELEPEMRKKLGIKQCPKCRQGIQKN